MTSEPTEDLIPDELEDDGEPRVEELIVPEEADGMRLDTFLARRQSLHSRTFFQQLIKDERVTVGGSPAKARHVVAPGEAVVVTFPPPESPWPHPQDLPVEFLYQDDDIVIVNKAAGMIVHPAAGNPDGTLVNALLHHCPDLPGINGVKRPGLVHRLDRETSGVMVIAKTERAMKALSKAIQARTVSRQYLLLTLGDPDWATARIDAPIGRHENFRIRRSVNGIAAKDAVTHLTVLARANGFALVKARLETGRTHQIRVHCSHVGLPIAGDSLYGGTVERALEKVRNAESPLRVALQKLDRPFLHARLLRFRHPETTHWVEYRAPVPPDLRRVLKTLFPEIDPESFMTKVNLDEPTPGPASDES
ncbi:MAG: RluA family pseudouridine synthase [Sumerlaeia bacterium]